MPRADLRDYLYISERKTERMVSTLPLSILKRLLRRLREISFSVGPVKAGAVLSDPQRQGLMDAVRDVEAGVRRQHTVRQPFDEGVRPGHWIGATAMEMAYGVPTGYGVGSEGAAVFTGSDASSYLLLCGSAEYLLDRSVTPANVGNSMSFPGAIGTLLGEVAKNRLEEEGDQGEAVFESSWLEVGYPIHNLLSVLSRDGLHPLTFLARVTQVSFEESNIDSSRSLYIVGTPLYVALDVPE